VSSGMPSWVLACVIVDSLFHSLEEAFFAVASF
jgi:hypothetical protein